VSLHAFLYNLSFPPVGNLSAKPRRIADKPQ
jgi:hypothetical protein